METVWAFDNCEWVAEAAKAYWSKKSPRLERLLKNWPEPLRRLRITMYAHPKHHRWEVRAVLQLPTAVLAAEEAAETWEKAMDEVADELVRQVKKHKELLRQEHLYRRRRSRRKELADATAMLARDVESQRQEAFFELLRPFMDEVARMARHEIRVMEQEGLLARGELSPGDLIDDVLLRAWERFNDRPAHIELDTWLIQLLEERLNELRAEREVPVSQATEPVVDEEPIDEDDLDDAQYWAEQLFLPKERFTLDELVPDHDVQSEWWGGLSEEQQRHELEQVLSRLPRKQRMALVLHAIEGYDPEEIALMQGRDVNAVKEDIEKAKQAVVNELKSKSKQQT